MPIIEHGVPSMKKIRDIDVDEIADASLRWSRYVQSDYPKWELNELHNEAFIISVHLVESKRYDATKSKLVTFLSYALPFEVRRRYRKMNGERLLTNKEGKKVYQRKEYVNSEVLELAESDCGMHIIEPKANSEWARARIAGFTARELTKRGLSYKKQKEEAKQFRNDQRKSKG
jgi:hypothetical protein